MQDLIKHLKINRIVLPVAAVIVAVGSFSGEGDAYLFPHVLAVSLVAMAVFDTVLEAVKKIEVKLEVIHLKQLSIGLSFVFCYILLAETIGFYLGGLLFMLATINSYAWLHYKDSSGEEPIQFIKNTLFAVGFCVFMYLLFSVLLKTQIPTGFWLP